MFSASGGWPERDLAVGKTMGALLTYYKQLAHNDKLEKERQKMSKRRTNIYMMDRYGYGLTLGKKGSPLSAIMSRSSSMLPVGKDVEAPVASEVIEEFAPLPDSIYKQPLVLDKVLSLDQKLREPGIQATDMKSLYPKHKHLMVRRSQRCKECEHNIFKPEFNPSSIKFKIQLGCLQYCPFLQILKHDNFIQDEPAQVVISITNPLDTIINVQLDKVDETYHGKPDDTAELDVPSSGFVVSAKDATVEFEVMGSNTADQYDDDPSIVHSRGPHKICVYASVTPRRASGPITCSMKLTYVYKTVTTPLIRRTEAGTPEPPAKPEEHEVSLPLYVQFNFGEINVSHA
jgi:dynactin-4